MNKVYDIITDKIIEQLNQGVIPWKQEWTAAGLPKNAITNKEYSGINPFLLMSNKYANPFWLTFKQAGQLGGNVKNGEKGTMIVFWKPLHAKPDPNKREGEISNIDLRPGMVLRYYYVFNVDQCEGLPEDKFKILDRINFNPIQAAENIVKIYRNPPRIKHEEQRAYYSPKLDKVNMPVPNSFCSPEAYYATLFHELIHSTGHADRLGRITEPASFGSHSYTKEELIAEMGSSFLLGQAGIFNPPQLEQASAYIQGWIKKLKEDNSMVIRAAGQAQTATNFILNKKVSSGEPGEERS